MFECFGDKQCFGGMFCATLRPDMQQILCGFGALGLQIQAAGRAWRLSACRAYDRAGGRAGAGRKFFEFFNEVFSENP